MDVLRAKPKYHLKRPLIIAGLVILGFVLLRNLVLQPSGAYKIERSQLLIGKVQRGDLQLTVDGYGVLRSYKQRLLTALTAATVAEVVLRPGAQVDAESVILRLSNPELLQEVERAKMALTQEQANLRRLKLDNQRQLLAEQSTLAQLNGELETIKLRSAAEKGLAGGAVSQLAYKTTLLQEQQTQERLQLQLQRIKQLKAMMAEALIIQQEQINQVSAQHQSMQERAERLTVKAGMSGVLQRLPVELGQSVSAGQELALVGSDKDLLALVRVSQSKAEQLQIGLAAQINTRRETVAGVVKRITPEVHEGTIEVEIAFSDGVPASARPELNVDAQIFTASLKNTLYIERPMNVQSHSKARLFQLHTDNKIAQAREITFGEDAERFIQITSGASEAEEFILSDMARFSEAGEVRLID
jgi:HlyD family secretion protein